MIIPVFYKAKFLEILVIFGEAPAYPNTKLFPQNLLNKPTDWHIIVKNNSTKYFLKKMGTQGIVKYVIDLVFQPGSSIRLVPAINGSLTALLMVLAWTWFYDVIEVMHIYVLSFLSIGLMGSVAFVGAAYEELKATKAKEDSEGKED